MFTGNRNLKCRNVTRYTRSAALVAILAGVFTTCPAWGQTAEDDSLSNASRIVGRTMNDREDQIIDVLSRDARCDYFETRFGDIVSEMQSDWRIPIVLDESAQDNNLDEDALITLTLEGVSFRSMMRIMLAPYQCDLMVKNEVLYIVSMDESNRNFLVRSYDCRELAGLIDGEIETNYAKLVNLVKTIVSPQSWSTGNGSAGMVDLGGKFIVRQTPDNHRQIEALLNGLVKDFSRGD